MKEKLHPGARWLFRIRTYSSLIVLCIFLFFFIMPIVTFLSEVKTIDNSYVIMFIGLGIMIIILIFVGLGEVYARMAYNRWFYDIGAENIRLERGIIWKRYSNIPYSRVQNVDINRGIIARMLGFSSVQIQTAGYSMPVRRGYGMQAEGAIPAVGIKKAEEIKEYVLKKIKGRSQGL